MKYNKIISLKDSRECCLRNGTDDDAREVLDIFNLTHAETDYLLTYPDENSFTAEQEGEFLKTKTESSNEIEIIAVVDGKIVPEPPESMLSEINTKQNTERNLE